MLRALSEGAFEGVLIHCQGVIRTANRAAERIAGVGPGQLVGRSLLDFIAPDHRGMVVAKIAANDDRLESLRCTARTSRARNGLPA